jgi:hypothetical protein
MGTVIVMAACSDGDTATTDPPAADVVLRVTTNGEVAADWTLAELEAAVEYTELSVDGNDQSGPLLLDVLEASGIDQWESAEILGMGEGRVFEVTLEINSSEVDNGWILDVTKQGTLKLASAGLPREQWVRDVGEIRIP